MSHQQVNSVATLAYVIVVIYLTIVSVYVTKFVLNRQQRRRDSKIFKFVEEARRDFSKGSV